MSLNPVYEMLLILNVLIHIYFSNLLLGGFPIMVITAWLGERGGQVYLKDLAKTMSGVGTKVMGAAITMGFLLWLMVYSRFARQWMHMLDAFLMGYGLMVILVPLSFWGIYSYYTPKFPINPFLNRRVIVGGLTVASLLGMTLLFVVAHILTLNPDYSEYVSREGLHAALSLPTVWPRFVHIVLGSVAATGIVITLYGTLRAGRERGNHSGDGLSGTPGNTDTIRYGVAWTLAGTLPQIVVGPWLLFALPDEVRMRLVDGASLSSMVFFVSLTLALLGLVLLNASLMVPHVRGLVWAGLGSLFLTIVTMVIVREEVRRAWMQSSVGADTFQELSGGVVLGVLLAILGASVVVSQILKGRFSKIQLDKTGIDH